MELDDVHCCHGETSTIDHASNRAIESDVVQVELGGGHFLGIFLREITLCEQIFLTEFSVVIETHLGVESEIC